MISREEYDGGRVMVMTNECDQEAEQRSGYGDKQVEQWIESCMRERESYIRYVR